MLDVKKTLSKVLAWVNLQGASATGAVNYGTATSITPSRSGWLVARGYVQTTQNTAPIIRILQGGSIVSEGMGLTVRDTALHTACYVRKGQTYTIAVFRCIVSNVTLY